MHFSAFVDQQFYFFLKWKWNWPPEPDKGTMQMAQNLLQLCQRCTKWRSTCPAGRLLGNVNIISKSRSQNGTMPDSQNNVLWLQKGRVLKNPAWCTHEKGHSFTCHQHLLNAPYICQNTGCRKRGRKIKPLTLNRNTSNLSTWACSLAVLPPCCQYPRWCLQGTVLPTAVSVGSKLSVYSGTLTVQMN